MTLGIRKRLRARVLRAACLIACAALLAACGERSILSMVEGTQGGVFTLNQKEVHLQASGEFTFRAEGGFIPYTYDLERNVGDLGASTGHYRAPSELNGSGVIDVPIVATDYSGASESALVRLYERLSVDPQRIEIEAGQEEKVDISVGGGLPEYTSELISDVAEDTRLQEPDPPDESPWTLTYEAPEEVAEETEEFVRIYDSIGNRITGRILVYPEGQLRITTDRDSLTYVIGEGDQEFEFTIVGGSEAYEEPTVEQDPEGIGSFQDLDDWDNENDDTFTFVVNEDPPEGSATFTVTDSENEEAQRTLVVVEEEPEELLLTPASVTLSEGGSAEFVASGGVGPYEFSVDPAAQHTLERISGDTVIFTLSEDLPPGFQDRTWEITVTDLREMVSSSTVHSEND